LWHSLRRFCVIQQQVCLEHRSGWIQRQGEKPIIGKKAIDMWLDGMRGDSDKIKVTDYRLNFQELEIVDGWAFEWGTSTETIQPLKGGEPKTANAKLLRVLRRQSDGSWKIARSVWNLDPGN
jgi:ketosteroid isomerase-like protein